MTVCDECKKELRGGAPPYFLEQSHPPVEAELCSLECVKAYVQAGLERKAGKR